ncbi:MAG: hypothetical protein U9P49_05835 [Thermodesulfobacteriota bacterium]|nr:hypothetical protein [Thermodesulfobacteriota bacterium]
MSHSSKTKMIARRKAIKKFKKGFPNDVDKSVVTGFNRGFNMGWEFHKKKLKNEVQ